MGSIEGLKDYFWFWRNRNYENSHFLPNVWKSFSIFRFLKIKTFEITLNISKLLKRAEKGLQKPFHLSHLFLDAQNSYSKSFSSSISNRPHQNQSTQPRNEQSLYKKKLIKNGEGYADKIFYGKYSHLHKLTFTHWHIPIWVFLLSFLVVVFN